MPFFKIEMYIELCKERTYSLGEELLLAGVAACRWQALSKDRVGRRDQALSKDRVGRRDRRFESCRID